MASPVSSSSLPAPNPVSTDWLAGTQPLQPLLALAPMQDVTHRAFWNLLARFGGADLYYTEYFRIHGESRLEKWILDSLVRNPTGRPVVAQMIGNNIPALVRSAKQLQTFPVAAIDLNLGCPAPVVYRKCAGGGLLRDLALVERIVGALREAIAIPFTVKTRVGFADPSAFEQLLEILARHRVDLLAVHGRTVLQMYRGEVNYDLIRRAVEVMPCPVLANGNVDSPRKAGEVLHQTKARGLMIGRGAIRNPWLFTQIRQSLAGQPVFIPRGKDVLEYLHALYAATDPGCITESAQVQNMKKYLNFLGAGVSGEFLHRIRRVKTREEMFGIWKDSLDHDEPMPLEAAP